MNIGAPNGILPPVDPAPIEGDLLVYNGTTWEALSPATDGHVLTSGGPGVVPAFEALPASVTVHSALSGLAWVGSGHTGTPSTLGGFAVGTGAAEYVPISTFGKALISGADASAGRVALGVVIGTSVQAYDATLASLSALGTAADRYAYTTGVDTWAEGTISAFARTLLDDADAAAARTTLGVLQGTLGAIYGGGRDGAFDLDGTNTYAAFFTKSGSTYTQIADVRSTTFRVRVGATLLPSQFWIYAETSFTNEGTIRNNGNNASGGTGGAQIAAAGTLQTNGQAGGAGRTTTNTGAVGSATVLTIGGAGGAGGAGGSAGGAAPTPGAIPSTSQGIGSAFFRMSHRILGSTAISVPGGGCGGSSGGATLNAGTATSGSGGGGASAIRVRARVFVNSGSITCNGGNGSNAAVTVDAVAGGGAGGGGGSVGVECDSYTNTGTISALGGTPGTGAGAGALTGLAGAASIVEIVTPTGTTYL